MENSRCLELIERHASDPGVVDSGIEGLTLFRCVAPTPPSPSVYPRSVCIILQGAKQAMLEDALYTYDASHYLCCSVPIPVQASILSASPQTPLLGAILRTDTPVMQDIALRMESTRLIGQEGSEIAPGICAAAWTPDFALALENLLCLLEEPDLIPVLGKARLQELMVAILGGQAGPTMRHGYGPAMEINRAIAHLREHPSQDISRWTSWPSAAA